MRKIYTSTNLRCMMNQTLNKTQINILYTKFTFILKSLKEFNHQSNIILDTEQMKIFNIIFNDLSLFLNKEI